MGSVKLLLIKRGFSGARDSDEKNASTEVITAAYVIARIFCRATPKFSRAGRSGCQLQKWQAARLPYN
jgi:hypothetical protein